MKKNIKIWLTSVALFSTLLATGQARDVSLKIDKENRNAVTISVPQTEDITRSALRQQLEKSGLKKKTRNGIDRYSGVVLSELSSDKMDIYTKVEKAINEGSNVYIAVSRGYNNFTNQADDSIITENVKTFLVNFSQQAGNYASDLAIADQIRTVEKEERALQQLKNERSELQGKKAMIDNRLAEIERELIAKETTIEQQQNEIKSAKVKRGS